MENKLIAGVLLFAVLMSGCMSPNGGGDNTTVTTQKVDVKSTMTTIPASLISTTTLPMTEADVEFEKYLDDYKQKRLFRNNYSVPDREAYGISTRIFEKLPPVPDDFLYKMYLLKYGRFVDIGSLGPEYYLQPEFDPLFTKFGLNYWKEWKSGGYKKTHWGTVGLRSYPYSQHILTQPGYSFNVTLVFSTDWNIETYQGVKLTPVYLTDAVSEDGKPFKASPDASKYINVNITPDEFLLTPAFPQFTENWAKKITFTGKVADDTPDGTYILSMMVSKPSSETSDKWLLQYLNLYSEGADMITTDKPYLQAFIYVQKQA